MDAKNSLKVEPELSKCPRPTMSGIVTAKEASVVDKLFSVPPHDHSTQSLAPFDLIFS